MRCRIGLWGLGVDGGGVKEQFKARSMPCAEECPSNSNEYYLHYNWVSTCHLLCSVAVPTLPKR